MIKVTTNIERFSARLREVMVDLANPAGALKMTGGLLVRGVQRNFRSKKNEDGSAWPALRYRRGGTPLVGKLGRMPKGVTSEVRGRSVVVGAGTATADYNAVHNFGSKLWKSGRKWKKGKFARQRKGIPQRQFMYITRADGVQIVREIKAYVTKKMREKIGG